MEPLSKQAARVSQREIAVNYVPLETAGKSTGGAGGAQGRGAVEVRLGLQRRAEENFRRHLIRAVRRVAVLIVGDLASFAVMRELVRMVRDFGTLGPGL